jgi:hypothetical protein
MKRWWWAIIIVVLVIFWLCIGAYVYADPYDGAACPGKKNCPPGWIALSCKCCAPLPTATPEEMNIPGAKDGCCPGYIQVKGYPYCCPLGYALSDESATDCIFVSCDRSHIQVLEKGIQVCKPKPAVGITIH